ncbi:hypothetical protein HZS_235 [Henneguya salminicola]|nr:hypothetical protein HZS_235 [Henneguya salminicola]
MASEESNLIFNFEKVKIALKKSFNLLNKRDYTGAENALKEIEANEFDEENSILPSTVTQASSLLIYQKAVLQANKGEYLKALNYVNNEKVISGVPNGAKNRVELLIAHLSLIMSK